MKSDFFKYMLLFQLLYLQVSGQHLKFVTVSPGETLVLTYNSSARFVTWFIPAHDAHKTRSVHSEDMYGQNRTWNIKRVAENADISNPEVANRLKIVFDNGRYFLQITNITSDDVGLYLCKLIVTKGDEPLEKTYRFIVQLKYTANLSITFDPPMPIYEGYSLHLCCRSSNDLPNETVRWYNKKHGLRKNQEDTQQTCIHFRNVNRKDTGDYICKADNEGRTVTENITLNVLFPPSITLLNHTFTSADAERQIQCIATGVPMRYTYEKWEHKSFFNEHIRFLDDKAGGNLILPLQKRRIRYQDSGIYICSVSNGVPNIHGKDFQTTQSHVLSKGPPVFVKANRRIQYGEVGKRMDLILNLHSFVNITHHYITTPGNKIIPLKAEISRTTTIDTFYGQRIKLCGWKIVFKFPDVTIDQFKSYTVYVSNEFGNVSFVTELQSKGPVYQKTNLKAIVAVIVSSLILIVIIAMMTKLIANIRKRNASLNVDDVVEAVEGQSESIENFLYQSANRPRQNIFETSADSSIVHVDTSRENTLSENGTLLNSSVEPGELMENQLNYADVIFQPSSSQHEIRIIGLEDRNVYAEVDTSVTVRLPEVQSDTSSSDDDFVYVDGIPNFIEKRETND